MKLTNLFSLQIPNVPSHSPHCPRTGGRLSTECHTQPNTVIRQAVTLRAPNLPLAGTPSSLGPAMPPSPPHLLQKRTERVTGRPVEQMPQAGLQLIFLPLASHHRISPYTLPFCHRRNSMDTQSLGRWLAAGEKMGRGCSYITCLLCHSVCWLIVVTSN